MAKYLSNASLPMRWLPWFLFIALIVLLDQWSKWSIVQTMAPGQSIVLLPFLKLSLVFNRGVAFGFLSHSPVWMALVVIALTLVAIGFFLVWLVQSQYTAQRVAIALIIGGALGNLIDRVRLSYVIDFIDAHIGLHHWPAFNLADSAICLGVALLIIHECFFQKKKRGKINV